MADHQLIEAWEAQGKPLIPLWPPEPNSDGMVIKDLRKWLTFDGITCCAEPRDQTLERVRAFLNL